MDNDIIIFAEKLKRRVIECQLEGIEGLCIGNDLFVDSRLTASRKRCVLAEELAHSLYNYGDITDLTITSNRKQELYARRRAYEMLVPPSAIKKAINKGARCIYEVAEELHVDEEFLRQAIVYYKVKQGVRI